MTSPTHPTPYPEVNLVLDELVPSIQSILGDHFLGMYLYGSLATGDFDQDSDVDYIVVTDDVLPDDLFSALDAMHERIKYIDSWCATQLEGSYIPQAALREYDPVHALGIHIDRGQSERLHRMHLDDPLLSRAWWGGWILLRDILYRKGITLAGSAPQTFIDPVSPDEVRQAASAILHGWTKQILDNPAEIDSRGYQSYTVLTLCRINYTLQNGMVVSKPVALRWAQESLDPRWSPLIKRAWLGRQNAGLKAEAGDVNETLEFIRYTLAIAKPAEGVSPAP